MTAPRNIPYLKAQLQKKLSEQILKNFFLNLLKRTRPCIAEEGNHFQHLV